VIHARGAMVLQSLGLAITVGIVTAGIGLMVCWLARESRWFHLLALGLMAVSWAIAGPIVGLGLNETIKTILNVADPQWLAIALYYGPSPVSALWAPFIPFFPFSVALLLPVVRVLPHALSSVATHYI